MLSSLLLTALFQGAGAPVVINEFSYDDYASTDDREFVELYNASKSTVDISGWKLESRDFFGTNSTFTIKKNTKLAPGAFYVLGSGKVPGVNQVVGVASIWENDDESLTLKDSKGKVVDTLAYEINKAAFSTWQKIYVEGKGIWGDHANVKNHETSWSRIIDGLDTGDNRDFHLLPWSPGKSNNQTKPALLFDKFDKGVVDTAHKGFGSSFDDAHYIDPTKTGGYNKGAIPASPQGGKALILWDRTGGGNTNVLIAKPIQNVVVECYVYFDATPEPVSGQYETWSIGVQGTTGTYFRTPDPSRRLSFIDNGNTGVAVTFQNTDKDAFLYLVDHANGGFDWKVLGKIQLFHKTSGSHKKNDGWQRLRLEVAGDYASVRFGGTYGKGDGAFLGGRVRDSRAGGIYFGYREAVSNNQGARPLTIDDLTVRPSILPASHFGKATATTQGTPSIGINTLPMLGTSGFALLGSGLAKSGASVYVLGSTRLNASISPPFPTGSRLHTAPVAVFAATNSAAGTSRLPVGIPNNSGLIGVNLVWQLFDFDRALKAPMPLGSSGGLEIRLGN